MTLIIKNVDEAFLPIFQGIAKSIKAKCEVDKDQTNQLIKEVKELKKQHKKGERKGYGSMKEFRKALENGEIYH